MQVHGLLHLLGFDHEISEEAEVEMENEEELLLKSLDWKGKGLIQSAIDAETNANYHRGEVLDGNSSFYQLKYCYYTGLLLGILSSDVYVIHFIDTIIWSS